MARRGLDFYLDLGLINVETFLRGIQITDPDPVSGVLYIQDDTRSCHGPGEYYQQDQLLGQRRAAYISVSSSSMKILLIRFIYELSPYSSHLSTLNRTTDAEDSLYGTATSEGYSAIISVAQIGDDLSDGLVGYITIGVNISAAGLTTTGGSVNIQGVNPTVSVNASKYAEAIAIDIADSYTS